MKNTDEQIKRIREMEAIYDRAVEVLTQHPADYSLIKSEVDRLIEYYEKGKWREDYLDDEAGKIPQDLKRGILSEDAIYDLICDLEQLTE